VDVVGETGEKHQGHQGQQTAARFSSANHDGDGAMETGDEFNS